MALVEAWREQAFCQWLGGVIVQASTLRRNFRCHACRVFVIGQHPFLLAPETRRGDAFADAVAGADASVWSGRAKWCLSCCRTLDGIEQAYAVTRRLDLAEFDQNEVPF